MIIDSVTKNLYILCGASGTGKTTAANTLEKLGYHRARTATTRKMRSGENEDSYYFLTIDEFRARKDFLEYTFYCGNYYGSFEEELDRNSICILEPNGVFALKYRYTSRPVKVILLEASVATILDRLQTRSEDTRLRLHQDAQRYRTIKAYSDLVIQTTTEEQTVSDIVAWIEKQEEMQR